jgi:hypothetical protein
MGMAFLTLSMADAKITPATPPVKENGGGNTPKGEANGVPTTPGTPATNPAGNEPGGHNK